MRFFVPASIMWRRQSSRPSCHKSSICCFGLLFCLILCAFLATGCGGRTPSKAPKVPDIRCSVWVGFNQRENYATECLALNYDKGCFYLWMNWSGFVSPPVVGHFSEDGSNVELYFPFHSVFLSKFEDRNLSIVDQDGDQWRFDFIGERALSKEDVESVAIPLAVEERRSAPRQPLESKPPAKPCSPPK